METKIKSTNEMSGAFLQFSTDVVKLKDGTIANRDFVKHPGGVSIICNVDGKLLCVKQYRYAVSQETIEIPAGKLTPGEDIEVAINRELIEETGYEAKSMEYLGAFIPAPGFCDETIHMFYSDDVVISSNPHGYTPDDDEDIEIMLLSVEELNTMFMDQKLTDYKTALGYFYFMNRVKDDK